MNLPLHSVNTQTWTNGRHQVRCVKVIQETWDVRTFCFMAEQPEAQEELEAIMPSDMLRVEFSSSGKSVQVAPGETVHAAAAKLGLYIPKACGMGICGTCKVLKTAGSVEMTQNGGITEDDIAEGYILSCCSIPQGDVVVEY